MAKYVSMLAVILSVTSIGPVQQNKYVVVELFTSQGCSSCPIADELLDLTIFNQSNVIGLSFHVDYWNYLGWKDPYSSKTFTERQRAYARRFNLSTIYTPQMVVNGSSEFVGSNTVKLQRAINSAVKEKTASLEITNIKTDNPKTLEFSYHSNVKKNGHWLNVAIVKKEVSNYVPKGENHGRTLKHKNVVVRFRSFEAGSSDRISIDVDQMDMANCSLVIYLQNKADMNILAADMADLDA